MREAQLSYDPADQQAGWKHAPAFLLARPRWHGTFRWNPDDGQA